MAPTFARLIKPYPAAVQSLARDARELILDLMGGDARETIDSSGPYAFYGYASGYKGLVCSLILSKNGVKLGIANAAALADPQKLLQGAGRVHKHIPLKSSADLKKPGLRPLVKSAIGAWQARNQ